MRYLLLHEDNTLAEIDREEDKVVDEFFKSVMDGYVDVIRFQDGDFQLMGLCGWQKIGGGV